MAHADHWQGCERRLKNLRADLRRREAVSRRVTAGEVQGTVVIAGETMSVDEESSPQQRQHDYDFSGLRSLQVVGSAAGAGGDEGPENSLWREALRSELEARAARFRQAVDASIVLANDGVIRWLGDPIAKLATGPDLLSPRAVILADTSLPEAAREAVAARLELWLAATTRRLLGPLLALRSLEDESGPVRDLAAKISESLGVLEREPMRSQIKALDQNSRAALRKHGVRFGAYYVYVPTVLKPASRALALQLWSLQTPQVDAEGLAKALIPMASSGRTSLAVDQLISTESYRVAGFRSCGERVVRVDIVERLADMIRAAFVPRSTSGGARSAGPVFIVSGQMTSLAGCSGETFASILRSLGFESLEIDRGELVLPRPAVEAQATSMSSSVAKAPNDSPAKDGAQSPSVPTCDVLAGPAPGQEREGEGEEEEGFSAAASNSEEPNGETREEDSGSDRPAEFALASNAAEVPESAGNNTSSTDTTVTAWRPVRKPRAEWRARHFHRSKRWFPAAEASTTRQASDSIGRGASDRGPERARSRRPAASTADRRDVGPPLSPAHGPSESAQADEKRRQTMRKRNTSGAAANLESQRQATIDPNSPFAKLLELRSILEMQGKNRS